MNYPCFEPFREIFACSTEREGGVSEGLYKSLNLCDYVEDEPHNVERNRAIFCKQHGIQCENLIFPRQTHGNRIQIINDKFLAQSETKRTAALYGIDGVITNVRQICIGVNTADCVPVLLFDPINAVIAAVHTGWRGTLAKIAQKAALLMHTQYGTEISKLIVGIGPSISVANYSLGQELYDHFKAADFPVETLFKLSDNRLHLDLWEANRGQLKQIGVADKNIYVSGICTYANSDRFFSARRLGTLSGRTASCIMLK